MSSAPRARSRLGARTALSTVGRGVAVALTVVGLVACTSVVGNPTPTGTGPTAASPSTPAPVLTPVDTDQCVVERTLPPDQNPLPAEVIRPPTAIGSRTQKPVETVPGADASGCLGSLPTSGCDEPRPWSEPPGDRFFTATRATRWVRGVVTWVAADTSHGAVATGVNDLQSVSYDVLQLRPGDPARTLAYLERSVQQCEGATPAIVGGRRALVGTMTSTFRQGPSTVVLLTTSDAAAWLVLDGTTRISQAELTRIVAVAASRLLPS